MSTTPIRALVLGGTAEAVTVADALSDAGVQVVYSLAGRTRSPRVPSAQVAVRVGGFGGIPGLRTFLQELSVDVVVDATHPFAEQISAHAAAATREQGVPILRWHRPGWSEAVGDDWRRVPDLDAAAALAPTLGRSVLLTVGRQELGGFTNDHSTLYLVRAVEPPEPLPANFSVVLERGPFTIEHELHLLRRNGIGVLVTKDSGGDATAAKLVAARQLGLPVVMVDRPPPYPAVVVTTVEESVAAVLRVAQSG